MYLTLTRDNGDGTATSTVLRLSHLRWFVRDSDGVSWGVWGCEIIGLGVAS